MPTSDIEESTSLRVSDLVPEINLLTNNMESRAQWQLIRRVKSDEILVWAPCGCCGCRDIFSSPQPSSIVVVQPGTFGTSRLRHADFIFPAEVLTYLEIKQIAFVLKVGVIYYWEPDRWECLPYLDPVSSSNEE
jgi:hypothetical protein